MEVFVKRRYFNSIRFFHFVCRLVFGGFYENDVFSSRKPKLWKETFNALRSLFVASFGETEIEFP